MSDFNPGGGWREVESANADQERLVHGIGADVKVWVREEPVPPLPTEPYTVIRVTWGIRQEPQQPDEWRKTTDAGHWWRPWEGGITVSTEWLAERITGFEVLAEPITPTNSAFQLDTAERHRIEEEVRRETAKAVLDSAWERLTFGNGGPIYRAVLEEFGVES